ncbi:MAG: hypothetical protein K0R80_2908 [Clostridia bacterium]|jgi:hypothetical protein|nr:hypothetical protein [Clostridia bacterium]
MIKNYLELPMGPEVIKPEPKPHKVTKGLTQ